MLTFLSNDPKKLEGQLSDIFELAGHWKALLLLDEADVYLRQRSDDHNRNFLVSVFLRMLEYYKGIGFLTTNRVTDFDAAMLSRIQRGLWYKPFGVKTRRKIWVSFLKKAVTSSGDAAYTVKELEDLAQIDLNGRQVGYFFADTLEGGTHTDRPPVPDQKYCTSGARLGGPRRVSYSHLNTVIDMGKEFENDFEGSGPVANMRSYF
jgi:hypothetical protein